MDKHYALVTGGSSGLGLEIARQLAARGYKLILVSDQLSRLEQLRGELSGNYGVDVQVYHTDLARREAASEVYDHCRKNRWMVDVLVNNAGFFFYGEAVEAIEDRSAGMVLLHVLTTTLLSNKFGRDMKLRCHGFILTVSSMSAVKAFPMIAHYGSSKAYLRYFTQSLRTELRPYGVKVSCLSPGAIATSLFDSNAIDVEKASKYGVMMTAERVASKAVNGLFRNRAVIKPGLRTKIFTFLSVITPQWIIQAIYNRFVYRNARKKG